MENNNPKEDGYINEILQVLEQIEKDLYFAKKDIHIIRKKIKELV